MSMAVPEVGTILDAHVHTCRGSSDSSLTPEDLVIEATRMGLAINLSEHNRTWDLFMLNELRDESGLVFCRGMEVSTDMGHMVVFGLDGYVSGIRSIRRLREVCDERGAFVVAAHPFRNFLERRDTNGERAFTLTPEEAAATMEVFDFVDGLEVGSGGTARAENVFAYEVAEILGKVKMGGSDAHSTSGLGSFTTCFSDRLCSDEEILEALHDGATTCYEGLHVDDFRPFSPSPQGDTATIES